MVQGLTSTKLTTIVQPTALGLQRTQRKAARFSKHSFRAGNSLNSMDNGSDEDDKSLCREFSQISKKVDPLKNAKVADHLNLLWSISQRKQPERCDCCRGSGEIECGWCHGTGAMTVGETLYCTEGGCAKCPICKGSGACQCGNCRGTGKRAAWMSPSGGDSFQKPL